MPASFTTALIAVAASPSTAAADCAIADPTGDTFADHGVVAVDATGLAACALP